MKTIQMTLDENLLCIVDKTRKRLRKTRSEFIRESLVNMLADLRRKELEKKHYDGYMKNPVRPGEFESWEDEQVWV